MSKATRPVSVAGIEFDALLDSDESYASTVPEFPTEEGYSTSDNVALDSLKLKMTLYVTDTPVTWRNRHGSGRGRSEQICDQLLNQYFRRELLTVVTSQKVYTNMVIKSINIKKSESQGYAKEVPIEFTQVTVTSAQAVGIPSEYARSGATMSSSGAASTSSSNSSGSGSGSGSNSGSEGNSGSILYSLYNKYTS